MGVSLAQVKARSKAGIATYNYKTGQNYACVLSRIDLKCNHRETYTWVEWEDWHCCKKVWPGICTKNCRNKKPVSKTGAYYRDICKYSCHDGCYPTPSPTRHPTRSPTRTPTRNPTRKPTRNPTQQPTSSPTQAPTPSPTPSPTPAPTTITSTATTQTTSTMTSITNTYTDSRTTITMTTATDTSTLTTTTTQTTETATSVTMTSNTETETSTTNTQTTKTDTVTTQTATTETATTATATSTLTTTTTTVTTMTTTTTTLPQLPTFNVTFDTQDLFANGWSTMRNALTALGLDETDFNTMVAEDFIRVQEADSGAQFKFTDTANISWPAHVLVWPINDLNVTNPNVTIIMPGDLESVSGTSGIAAAWVVLSGLSHVANLFA